VKYIPIYKACWMSSKHTSLCPCSSLKTYVLKILVKKVQLCIIQLTSWLRMDDRIQRVVLCLYQLHTVFGPVHQDDDQQNYSHCRPVMIFLMYAHTYIHTYTHTYIHTHMKTYNKVCYRIKYIHMYKVISE